VQLLSLVRALMESMQELWAPPNALLVPAAMECCGLRAASRRGGAPGLGRRETQRRSMLRSRRAGAVCEQIEETPSILLDIGADYMAESAHEVCREEIFVPFEVYGPLREIVDEAVVEADSCPLESRKDPIERQECLVDRVVDEAVRRGLLDAPGAEAALWHFLRAAFLHPGWRDTGQA